MKNTIFGVLFMMLGTLLSASEGLDIVTGGLRVGVQHDTSTQKYDIAVGGHLHAENEMSKGVKIGGTFYTTNVLFEKNDANAIPFFGSTAQSYSLLNEAYLQISYHDSKIILGRQIIDTPYADSDDIGMIPDSYEAYTLIDHHLTDTMFTYSFLRNISGVDADIPERFTAINGNSGIHMLGASYEGDQDIVLSGWYYVGSHFGSIGYVESRYQGSYEALSYTISGQSALVDITENKSAKVVGVNLELTPKDLPISFALSYGKSFDGVASNGFGGGPYFVSCEHLTLEDMGADGAILKSAFTWDVREDMTLSFSPSYLQDGYNHHGHEVDIRASYSYHDRLSFDAIYSTLDASKISGDKYDNMRLFANLRF